MWLGKVNFILKNLSPADCIWNIHAMCHRVRLDLTNYQLTWDFTLLLFYFPYHFHWLYGLETCYFSKHDYQFLSKITSSFYYFYIISRSHYTFLLFHVFLVRLRNNKIIVITNLLLHHIMFPYVYVLSNDIV